METLGGDILESILDTIKQMLGIQIDDESFDPDIKVLINTVTPNLAQMGIGPINGFIVTNKDQLWSEYIDSKLINLEGVKQYIYLKVKLIFDPPTNSTVVQAINDSLKELEYRMNLAVETNNLEV